MCFAFSDPNFRTVLSSYIRPEIFAGGRVSQYFADPRVFNLLIDNNKKVVSRTKCFKIISFKFAKKLMYTKINFYICFLLCKILHYCLFLITRTHFNGSYGLIRFN